MFANVINLRGTMASRRHSLNEKKMCLFFAIKSKHTFEYQERVRVRHTLSFRPVISYPWVLTLVAILLSAQSYRQKPYPPQLHLLPQC